METKVRNRNRNRNTWKADV